MNLGDAAVLVLVAVLAGAAFWRRHFWVGVGLILLALLIGMGLLL
jgi:hypothetical protein